ncbi:MAG: caspase family protein [Oscillospiraceae bacterium]|nr:caspase family protein [Oscillospiraceae bacterium]
MRKAALCIGNNGYQILPRLACCICDATAISQSLTSLGFETILQTDLDRESMTNEIIEFAEKADQYDVILLYYAGHGFQADGDNILAPIDLNINARPAAIRMSAFPLSELMNQLNKYPEQTKIVILDACRETLGYRGSFQYFAPVSAPQGSVIAFSTSPGQSAKENDATGHGKYTEALLRYISLPRVPVETVFKKVRELLVSETGGTQIPWEHTSLIGDFYFNPDTIYDGITYTPEAKADGKFHFSQDSPIRSIVEGLKSYNWPTQEAAERKISGLDYSDLSSNELFVLGRNIYQSACGNSYACQRFISRFANNSSIPQAAKLHILNGMAYEIYFDSENNLRSDFKSDYYSPVISCLEQAQFYANREFLASFLCKVEQRPIYIPGQNEIMDLNIKGQNESDRYRVLDIYYQGKPILFEKGGSEKLTGKEYSCEVPCNEFEQRIASILAAPLDCVRFQYDAPVRQESTLLIPYNGFCIQYGF